MTQLQRNHHIRSTSSKRATIFQRATHTSVDHEHDHEPFTTNFVHMRKCTDQSRTVRHAGTCSTLKKWRRIFNPQALGHNFVGIDLLRLEASPENHILKTHNARVTQILCSFFSWACFRSANENIFCSLQFPTASDPNRFSLLLMRDQMAETWISPFL